MDDGRRFFSEGRGTINKFVKIAETGLIDFITSSASCDPRRRSAAVRLLQSQVRIPLRLGKLVFYICSVLCR